MAEEEKITRQERTTTISYHIKVYLYLVLLLITQPLHNNKWKTWKKEHTLMDDKASNWCKLEVAEVVDKVLHQSQLPLSIFECKDR